MSPIETPCHEHEVMIQDNTKDIAALATRADYKDKRIDELSQKMDKMEDKLDKLNENIDKIIQSSIKSDNDLEIRLTQLETTVRVLKYITTLLFGSGLIWVLYSFIH